ncbi:tripartite ATP-independent transporter DctM subunit [Aliiruegeria haliotis]|uniref:TRAP transporter large permease protein n=1 Tax=Aliiruegeria haliotis TaxID=1280846 RepID=A0A2T0RZT6_9RHOB|nr:TRAP transporter large permease [Aliiruegeria haliotis]PRY26675.1 tripartite ATP-independent transporter DctM subunit [Aliiruegeria haliotis]
MTGLELALVALALMLVAVFLRVPIAIAMGLTGFFGTWYLLGTAAGPMAQLKTLSYETFSNQGLAIVPLFLLMGQVATRTGMSAALFRAASDWLGHRRGGIAMASVGACAGFGAICGSSLATASTMGQVALPEMRRRGYSDALSTGVLAAGGTLGILIPPSVILVFYAILAEQNIVKMFMAALVPGLLAAVGYMITVALYVRLNPTAGPTVPRKPYTERWRGLAGTWPVLAIFGLTMGGIVGDWDWSRPGDQALFTPNEAAAFGATATALYGIVMGRLTLGGLLDAFLETAKATGMIFFILLGAEIFKGFLALTRAPDQLAEWVLVQGYAPIVVLVAMLCCYLVFGCVMESLSMILLTVPIFLPVIEALDFGMTAEQTAIWFGILALIVVEVGLITPPVGMNLFILNGVAPDIPLRRTYAGVAPFVASDLVRVAVLVAFPGITLWLVGVTT